MQLYYSPASPFARKVRVLASEVGLSSSVELINPGALTPLSPNEAAIAANPLGKIPSLVLSTGQAISDSAVICEYLDSLHDGEKMFPAQGEARFSALTTQSLADGLMDTLVLLRYETFLRPEEKRWGEWITKQTERCNRVLDYFNSNCPASDAPVTIGTIGMGCALSYMDFRFAADDWRASRRDLAAWHKTFSSRAAMLETAPE